MIELPEITFCKILPDLPKPSKLRRQVRKDGGYDMVPAYTDEEMFKYGEVCAAEAREQMREECITKKQADKVIAALETARSTCTSPRAYGQLAGAIDIMRGLEDAEPVEYQILILGKRWTHCTKELYDKSEDRTIVRALYTSPQAAQTPAALESKPL